VLVFKAHGRTMRRGLCAGTIHERRCPVTVTVSEGDDASRVRRYREVGFECRRRRRRGPRCGVKDEMGKGGYAHDDEE
jgi:hypothetical protein